MDDASQTKELMTPTSDPLLVSRGVALTDSAPPTSTLGTPDVETSDGLMDGYVDMAESGDRSGVEESENEGNISTSDASEGAGDPETEIYTVQKDKVYEGHVAVTGESSNGSPDVISIIPLGEKANRDVSSALEEERLNRDDSGHPISLCERDITDGKKKLVEVNDGHDETSISQPGKMAESEEVELPTLKVDQTSAAICKRTLIPDSEDAEDEEEHLRMGECKILGFPRSEGTEELVKKDSFSHRGKNQNLTEPPAVAENDKAVNASVTVVDTSRVLERDKEGTIFDLAGSLVDADSPTPSIDETPISTVLYEKTLDEEVSKEGKERPASTAKDESRNNTVNTSANPSNSLVQGNDEATHTNQNSDDVDLDLTTQDSLEDTPTIHNNIHVQTTFNPLAENSVSKGEPTAAANSVTSLANTNNEGYLQDLQSPSTSSSSSFQQPSTVADIPPIEPVSSTIDNAPACTGERIPSITEGQVVIFVQEPASSLLPASSPPELPRKRTFHHQREPISSPLKAMLSWSPPTKKQKTDNLEAMPGLGEEKEVPKNKDELLMDELRTMKIASIQARNSSLETEVARVKARLEAVTNDLEHPAAETVKSHIHLLHQYNDIRDVGQGLLGMIADNRGGMRVGDLYEEFGVGLQD